MLHILSSLQQELSLVPLFLAILTCVRWNLRVILICISLIGKNVEHVLSVSQSFESLLLRILFRSVPHYLIRLFGLLIFSFMASLYILEISLLSGVELVRSFPVL